MIGHLRFNSDRIGLVLFVGQKIYLMILLILKTCNFFLVHGKNGFAERSKILAGYKSEKQFC